MTTQPDHSTVRLECNPARHACQWCPDRPAIVVAFSMRATTVRICPQCYGLVSTALRTATEFEETMRRVEEGTADEAVAEHARLALALGRAMPAEE